MEKDKFIELLLTSDKFKKIYSDNDIYWATLIGSRSVFDSFNTGYCAQSDFDITLCGIKPTANFSIESKIDDINSSLSIHYTIDNIIVWDEKYIEYLPAVNLLRICQHYINNNNLLLLKDEHKQEYDNFIGKLATVAKKAARVYLQRNYDKIYKWATRINETNYNKCALIKTKNYYYIVLAYFCLTGTKVDLTMLDKVKNLTKENRLETLKILHEICHELISKYNLSKNHFKKDSDILNFVHSQMLESSITPPVPNEPNVMHSVEVI